MDATLPSGLPDPARGPRHRSRPVRHATALLAFALLLLALLAGCAGSGSEQSTSADPAPAQDAPGSGGDAAAPAEQQDKDGAARQVAPGEPDPNGAAGNSGSGGGAGDVKAADRAVIHTAELTVEVDGVNAAVRKAKKQADTMDGYVAAQTLDTASEGVPRASVTVKVPEKRYEDALEKLSGLGHEVSLDSRVDDVTEEVADVDARVTSAEASLKRLRALLDDAESVQEVLSVETEINTRTGDLEALKAQQASLADQTSYATITLTLVPPDSYVPERDPEDSGGFLSGLRAGWNALVDLLQGALVVFGALLPFLVFLAIVASPFVVWWRYRRRRTRATAAGGRDGEGNTAVPVGVAASTGPAETAGTNGAAGTPGTPGAAGAPDATGPDNDGGSAPPAG